MHGTYRGMTLATVYHPRMLQVRIKEEYYD